jgi:AraC-like DNA-binding protein
MNTPEKVHSAREKVLRRQRILEEAIAEFDKAATERIQELEVLARSRPIKVTDMVRLLGLSRSQLYRIGAADCSTYAQLWHWAKVNRPELLQQLERNYEREFLNQ